MTGFEQETAYGHERPIWRRDGLERSKLEIITSLPF